MFAVIPEEGSIVNAEIVRSFRKLASCGVVKPGASPGHSDGWGIVSWREGRPFYIAREPTDAWTDPKYESACREIEQLRISAPLIVHLRKASVGTKSLENTHPFIIGEWGFAHNGTIRRQNLKGKTDSEWFFESLLHEKELARSQMEAAIARQVASVRSVYEYSSMTFLLSDGRDFFAYRDFSRSGEYYTMLYTKVNGALILCQEKFFDSNWTDLENEELLRFKNNKLEVSKPPKVELAL